MGRMRVEVNLTKEDHIQMQVDHNLRSKTMKGLKALLFILGVFSILIFILFIILQINDLYLNDIGVFAALVSISVVGITSPFFMKPMTKAIATSFVAENSIESHCGLNIIELNEDRITRRMEKRYEEMDWSIIQRYVETKDHIYIYDSSVSNIIVPKRDLDRETIKELIIFIERKLLE